MTLLEFSSIYMVSQLNFINSVSYMDDIQDVSARTVNGKVEFSAGEGGPTPTWLRACHLLHLYGQQ